MAAGKEQVLQAEEPPPSPRHLSDTIAALAILSQWVKMTYPYSIAGDASDVPGDHMLELVHFLLRNSDIDDKEVKRCCISRQSWADVETTL